MNKQYVQEQIKIAINELKEELEEEYGSIIGNIYQCPDCGAIALKNSEHICFRAAAPVPVVNVPPKRITLIDRVFATLPIGAPPVIDLFEADSIYTPGKIADIIKKEGYPGSIDSIKAAVSELWRAGRINRRPAALKVANGKRSPVGGVAGFVYWRTI